MASQQEGMDDDAIMVFDDGEDAESSMGENSPDRVLPLDSLKYLVQEYKDDHPDIPACAWDTIDECITEATVRLAFESANATARGKRNVITAEDVMRAIEGLKERDASLGTVVSDMNAILSAEKRAAAMQRRREQRLRKKLAEEQKKAKEWEGASGAGLQY